MLDTTAPELSNIEAMEVASASVFMSEEITMLRAAVAILSASVDYKTTLEALARLAVPGLCDVCAVFINEKDQTIRRLAIARSSQDPSGDADEPVFPAGDEGIRRSLQAQPENSVFFCIPVAALGRKIGFIAFLSLNSRKTFDDRNLSAARDLAGAAAIALENARMYRETQEANRLKNEFVAVVSHELRTPLTPILGCVHLLKTAKLSEANFARALEMIERNAQAQVQMVEDLMDVTKMVAGQLRLAVKPVNPVPIMELAVAAVQPAADSKDIRIVSSLEPAGEPLEADPDRLRQAVWNLLSNAVKFTPAGGRVEIGLRWIDNIVQIKVADTGVGIPADVLPYIFDRFRRADDPSARLRTGLGLGLAIVRHVVELHSGTVNASSPGPGGGAIFTLTFPLQARKAATSTS